LHPDPYPSREAWCWARIAKTEQRLAECNPDLPVIFVNHYPLVREPTEVLRYPQFAQWCGTTRTGDWHRRYNAAVVVYGHLHIPRTTWHDGVRFEEVSVGYPREWKVRASGPGVLRQILPLCLRDRPASRRTSASRAAQAGSGRRAPLPAGPRGGAGHITYRG
jgi:hypothetical protein